MSPSALRALLKRPGPRTLWRAGYVAASVVGAIVGLEFVGGARQEYDAKDRMNMSWRNDLLIKQQKAANLEALERQLEDVTATLHHLVRRLPSRFEEPEIQRSLEERAILNGVSIGLVRRREEEEKEFYWELPFDVVLRGKAAGVVGFLNATAADPRIQTLRSLTMTLPRGAAVSELRTEITLVYYRYVEL